MSLMRGGGGCGAMRIQAKGLGPPLNFLTEADMQQPGAMSAALFNPRSRTLVKFRGNVVLDVGLQLSMCFWMSDFSLGRSEDGGLFSR